MDFPPPWTPKKLPPIDAKPYTAQRIFRSGEEGGDRVREADGGCLKPLRGLDPVNPAWLILSRLSRASRYRWRLRQIRLREKHQRITRIFVPPLFADMHLRMDVRGQSVRYQFLRYRRIL